MPPYNLLGNSYFEADILVSSLMGFRQHGNRKRMEALLRKSIKAGFYRSASPNIEKLCKTAEENLLIIIIIIIIMILACSNTESQSTVAAGLTS